MGHMREQCQWPLAYNIDMCIPPIHALKILGRHAFFLFSSATDAHTAFSLCLKYVKLLQTLCQGVAKIDTQVLFEWII